LRVHAYVYIIYIYVITRIKFIDGWTDGWTDGWMDGWMDGRMDG
jgi:organic anion transporter 5A